MSMIARAIDLGYGNCKFTIGDRIGEDIPCRLFPSVAPKASVRVLQTGGANTNLNVVNVDVEGELYAVGPDGLLAMPSNGCRSLDTDFVKRPEYLALLRGAFHYMDVPHIDSLYLGLPVSTVETVAGFVEDLVTGKHPLPGNRSVTVSDVVVVPQPVGGLYDYGARTRLLPQLQSSTNLLIDPGYFTLDWVVTHGTKMLPGRSGAANNGGMAAILRAMGEQLTTTLQKRDGRPYDLTETILNRMDLTLRTGAEFRFAGRREDLMSYLPAGNKVVEDALNKLVAGVGSILDIDNIVLVGG